MSMMLIAVLAATVIGPLEETVVTPAWVERSLTDPSVIVVEVGPADTAKGPHIPGARFLAIESIVKQDGWPPDELPPVAQLRRAFEQAGIGDDGRIVLYSADPLHATRAWFTLDTLGQGDRTAILDGGFERWTAEQRPVARQRFPRQARTFTPYPDRSRVIPLARMRSAITSGAVLIDARPVQEYEGLYRGNDVPRRGHIPGASCEPWQTNLTRNGSFRSARELEERYARLAGEPGENRVIVYCRTGMEATMPYFVLRSLGYDVVLYDGSFTEWSRDPFTPVERTSFRVSSRK